MSWFSQYIKLFAVFATIGFASCGEINQQPSPTVEQKAPRQPELDASGDQMVGPQDADPPNTQPQPSTATSSSRKDELESKVVGVWRQENTGTRWLRLRDDGTGTMYVDPDWIAKSVIGDSLTISIEWVIQDGRAIMTSVSGQPETAFKAVSSLYGTVRNQRVVEVNDQRFVLQDDDGSESEWTRVDSKIPLPDPVAQ